MGDASDRSDSFGVVTHPFPEGFGCNSVIVRRNRMCGDELACVGKKRIDLCVDETGDVLNMIWVVGFK